MIFITFRPFLIYVWVPLTITNVTLKGGVGEVGGKEKKEHSNVDLAQPDVSLRLALSM